MTKSNVAERVIGPTEAEAFLIMTDRVDCFGGRLFLKDKPDAFGYAAMRIVESQSPGTLSAGAESFRRENVKHPEHNVPFHGTEINPAMINMMLEVVIGKPPEN